MDSKTKETVDLKIRRQKHLRLMKLATEQGVKPTESTEAFYSKFDTEDLDVDEFLKFVRELR